MEFLFMNAKTGLKIAISRHFEQTQENLSELELNQCTEDLQAF